MAKKAKTTDVALISDVPSVLDKLNAEISSLKKIEESVYKTTGKVDGLGIDIKTELKVDNLIKAFSSISGRAKAYGEAAQELGQKSVPQFTVGGGTVDEWKSDIMLRIDIINHKEKLDKLKGFKDKMSKFLSEEDQKAILLKEMGEYLSNN